MFFETMQSFASQKVGIALYSIIMKRQSERRNRKRRGKAKVPSSQARTMYEPTVYELIARNFVACQRCDHFLSGYRAHVGTNTLNEQIDAQHNNWLTLSLNDNVRRRVAGAYGYEISADTVFFEGRCDVCGRLFVLEMDGENLLYMQADPRVIELSD